jgi:hypothetical protein
MEDVSSSSSGSNSGSSKWAAASAAGWLWHMQDVNALRQGLAHNSGSHMPEVCVTSPAVDLAAAAGIVVCSLGAPAAAVLAAAAGPLYASLMAHPRLVPQHPSSLALSCCFGSHSRVLCGDALKV